MFLTTVTADDCPLRRMTSTMTQQSLLSSLSSLGAAVEPFHNTYSEMSGHWLGRHRPGFSHVLALWPQGMRWSSSVLISNKIVSGQTAGGLGWAAGECWLGGEGQQCTLLITHPLEDYKFSLNPNLRRTCIWIHTQGRGLIANLPVRNPSLSPPVGHLKPTLDSIAPPAALQAPRIPHFPICCHPTFLLTSSLLLNPT